MTPAPLTDILHVVGLIERALPVANVVLAPPTLPDLSAAEHLAQQLGGNATRYMRAHHELAAAAATISDVAAQAQPLIMAAQADIVGEAQRLLALAQQDIIGMLNPVPGAAAAALLSAQSRAGELISYAISRLTQLGDDLSPLTQRLHAIAASDGQAAPPPTHPNATAPDAPVAPLSSTIAHSSGGHAGARAVAAARSQLGVPYVWGGSTPGVGFDCSGLTQWAWRQAGVELPRLAQEQNIGRPVGSHELIEGDLLVWDGHVAMYAGDGTIIEAGNPVSTSPLRTTNLGMAFKGYFRPTG